MEPTGCPETSVRNYHYSLCDNPEEESSHLLRGGSLKSRRKLILPVEFQTITGYFDLLNKGCADFPHI
jgi:hypothetical protein